MMNKEGAIKKNLKGIIKDNTIKALQRGRSDYNKKYLNDKEEAIYRAVRICSIGGDKISHNQLAKIVGMDRKALRPYTKSLLKKGLMGRETGLRGRYFQIGEDQQENLFNASLFGEQFRSRLLLEKNEDLILTNKRSEFYAQNTPPFEIDPYCIDFTSYHKFFKPLFTSKDHLESRLFEFSNRVGAFVVYSLIQSLNPDNIKLSHTKDEQDLAKKWAHSAISKVVPFLIFCFRDMIKDSIEGQFENSSKFIFDGELVIKLLSAFRHLYPLLSHKFEDIAKELPEYSKWYNDRMENLREKWKRQMECKHKYNNKKPTFDPLHGYYIRVCSKCGHRKKVNSLKFQNKKQ